MNRTIVLCVSWKGPIDQTSKLIDQLTNRGAGKLIHTGVTDVSLARNLGFQALLDALPAQAGHDTLLLLDDDIEPTWEDADRLVMLSRRMQAPVSGVYGTAGGVVAARYLGPDASPPWLVGLGFLALPLVLLRQLAARLPELTHARKKFRPFCSTGIHPAEPSTWTSEDFWFCRELGGVHMAPIPAKHWKTLPIVPPESELEKVAALFSASPGDRKSGSGG
jgi:hypothetical protein